MDHLDKLIIHSTEVGKSWLYAVGMTFAEIYPEGSLEDRASIAFLCEARGYDPADALEGYLAALTIRKANASLA